MHETGILSSAHSPPLFLLLLLLLFLLLLLLLLFLLLPLLLPQFHIKTYFCLNSLFQLIAMILAFLVLLPLLYTDLGLKLLLKVVTTLIKCTRTHVPLSATVPRLFQWRDGYKEGSEPKTGKDPSSLPSSPLTLFPPSLPPLSQLEKATFTITLDGTGYSNDQTDRYNSLRETFLLSILLLLLLLLLLLSDLFHPQLPSGFVFVELVSRKLSPFPPSGSVLSLFPFQNLATSALQP